MVDLTATEPCLSLTGSRHRMDQEKINQLIAEEEDDDVDEVEINNELYRIELKKRRLELEETQFELVQKLKKRKNTLKK